MFSRGSAGGRGRARGGVICTLTVGRQACFIRLSVVNCYSSVSIKFLGSDSNGICERRSGQHPLKLAYYVRCLGEGTKTQRWIPNCSCHFQLHRLQCYLKYAPVRAVLACAFVANTEVPTTAPKAAATSPTACRGSPCCDPVITWVEQHKSEPPQAPSQARCQSLYLGGYRGTPIHTVRTHNESKFPVTSSAAMRPIGII